MFTLDKMADGSRYPRIVGGIFLYGYRPDPIKPNASKKIKHQTTIYSRVRRMAFFVGIFGGGDYDRCKAIEKYVILRVKYI